MNLDRGSSASLAGHQVGQDRPATDDLREVQALLDQHAASQSTTADESGKGERRRLLLEADARVSRWVACGASDAQTLVLHAELASHLEIWDESIVRWSRVLRSVPSMRDTAHFELAVSYRGIESYRRARESLRRAKQGGFVREAVAAERRQLTDLESEWAARIVGNRLVSAVTARRGRQEIMALLEAYLQIRPEPEAVSSCIRQVVRFLSRDVGKGLARVERALRRVDWRHLVSDRGDVFRRSAPKHASCVFFCGFGWSGSGALFDYFAQSSLAATPFDRNEIGVFERDWGARKTLRLMREDPKAVRKHMIRFILHSVLGIGGPLASCAESLRRASVLHSVDGDPALLAWLARSCRDVYLRSQRAARRDGIDGVESVMRGYLDALISSLAGPGRTALMSNCITAAHADLVRLVTNGKAYVVLRDPRDQYVSQALEYRDGQTVSCETFIEKMARRLDWFEEAKARAPEPERIKVVRFEEFVLSPKHRKEIGADIGLLPHSFPIETMTYHPEQSLPNIGIYERYPRKDEIRRIEESLPEALFFRRE